jgi:hypothetical protein
MTWFGRTSEHAEELVEYEKLEHCLMRDHEKSCSLYHLRGASSDIFLPFLPPPTPPYHNSTSKRNSPTTMRK